MREIRSIEEMHNFALRMKLRGKKIAFVPTMGALHEGHLSLVEEAKKRGEVVVVSIFVNPIQFGPKEDFARYPRNLKKDKKLLQNFDIDVLFVPDVFEIFPPGFKTYVEVEKLSQLMCGKSRPTHFRGVATIVAKLFNIVCPDVAIFGEKDFQQLVIIKQMVRDLNFPAEIVSCPTVREFDGLAMSSRNAYLTSSERKSATILYQALLLAKEEIEKGERDAQKIITKMRTLISLQPNVRIDYLVIVDPVNLEEVKKIKGKVLVALAAYLGKARLIDNMIVEGKK